MAKHMLVEHSCCAVSTEIDTFLDAQAHNPVAKRNGELVARRSLRFNFPRSTDIQRKTYSTSGRNLMDTTARSLGYVGTARINDAPRVRSKG